MPSYGYAKGAKHLSFLQVGVWLGPLTFLVGDSNFICIYLLPLLLFVFASLVGEKY